MSVFTSRTVKNIEAVNRPLETPFRIAHQEHFDITTVTVTIETNSGVGHGECNPFSVSGWSKNLVESEINAAKPLIERGIGREVLLEVMRPGPARNAVDSALVDLECQERGLSAGELFNIEETHEIHTAMTVGLPEQDELIDFSNYGGLPSIKMKIDADSDPANVLALRQAAPTSRIIVDANGSLDAADVARWLPVLRDAGMVVLEQPVTVGAEDSLLDFDFDDILVCADESFRCITDLPKLSKVYKMVNVKLDKAGGPTAGFQIASLAPLLGLRVMVGCMIGTSLSAAPSWWLAQSAEVVDIDGPTWLSNDVENPLTFNKGQVSLPSSRLWG